MGEGLGGGVEKYNIRLELCNIRYVHLRKLDSVKVFFLVIKYLKCNQSDFRYSTPNLPSTA